MNSIWLHRISHHMEVSHRLLSNNCLSIGFSDFADAKFIDNVLDNGWEALNEAFDSEWGNQPRTRHNLWRFIHEMKTGDWVVVPMWENFAIYEIVGSKPQPIGSLKSQGLTDWHENSVTLDNGLLYRENGDLIDLGFFWEVKPIRTEVSRYDYADAALTARMKVRGTNVQITDLRGDVEKSITAFDAGNPINVHAQITETAVPAVLKILHSSLNPKKLEHLVKWYFERIGASDVNLPSGNAADKGEGADADVIATFEPIKTIIYVQAKLHQGETDSWASKQVAAYKEGRGASVDDYHKISWVISTADSFSTDSIEHSKENDVRLINGLQFAKMLLEAGIDGLANALSK